MNVRPARHCLYKDLRLFSDQHHLPFTSSFTLSLQLHLSTSPTCSNQRYPSRATNITSEIRIQNEVHHLLHHARSLVS